MKQARNTLFAAAPWAQGLDRESAAAIAVCDWWDSAQRVHPANTQRAWRAHWHVYEAFCVGQGVTTVPATAATVAAFVDACGEAGKKPATIRRYLTAIALAHRVAKFTNPCTEEPVRHALKGFTNGVSSAQRQAKALGWAEIQKFIETAGEGLPATRERALLCVAYDTMARRSEFVAFNRGDFKLLEDGSGRALIRRSKTDQAGKGAQAYLSRETVRHIQQWMRSANTTEGAIFRRLIGRKVVGPRLSVDMVSDIFKRVGRWIKLPEEEVAMLSGHSVRVGATQDLLALNINLASVMQSGRWKSTHMPMRYGEHVLAARGGMARAASEQGRN